MTDKDVSERLLIAGKLLGKTLAGYRDDDLRSAARGAVDLGQLMFDANDEIERLRAALKDIECRSIDHTDACRMAGKARRALEHKP